VHPLPACRSRERKSGRISGLQQEVDALRGNNFVLAKCVEEVAAKALRAREEQRQLRVRALVVRVCVL
jgi:hypothetical protein